MCYNKFWLLPETIEVPYPTLACTNAHNTAHNVIQFCIGSPCMTLGIPLMVGDVIANKTDQSRVQLAALLNLTNFSVTLDYGTTTQK